MMNTDLWIFDSRHDQRSILEIYSLNIPVTLRLIGGIIRYDLLTLYDYLKSDKEVKWQEDKFVTDRKSVV